MTPERLMLADMQSPPHPRNIQIDGVGVKGVRYPLTIRSSGAISPTIATLSMTVSLLAAVKGTHMSRFVEMLEAHTEALTCRRRINADLCKDTK